MAKFGFDTSDVELESVGGTYEPLPKGEYTVVATEATLKDTARGDGQYIAVTFEILDGKYAGRKVWDNFNVSNPSEKAQQIGRQQLVAWAHAAGKPDADDTDELLDRPCKAYIKIEKGTDGYEDKNRIGSFIFDAKVAGKPKEKVAEAAAKQEPKTSSGNGKKNPWD